MKGGLWRPILGWFLVVAGILVVLVGALAFGGSYLPDTQDQVSTRVTAAVVMAVGLLLGGVGIRLIRSWRRVARTAPRSAKQARGLTKVHAFGYAAAVVLGAGFGVFAIIYSFSFDAEVQSFRSAHRCSIAADTDCYQLHDVTITGVDVSHGNSGETDTVDFMDSGSLHKVAIHPRGLDSSVLVTGADGVATFWHGKYTNLDVSGVSFATFDNPVGQRGEWRLIGFIVLGTILLQVGVLGGGVLYMRRRTAEPPPQSSIGTTGYPILPLVLHPNTRKSQLLLWLVVLPVGLLFEFAYFAQFGRLFQWLIGVGLVLVVAARVVWQFVLAPRSAIYVDEISFGTVGGLGRRKSWARTEAARVVLRSLDRGRRTPALPLAIVVGPDGHARMRFSALRYDADSFVQLAAALRVPLDEDSLETPTGPAQLEREIPGTVSWGMRHATALGAGIAIVLIAVISLAVGLNSEPSHR